jgi:two-component system, cell cycle sensor histidine kinase and response regulator CckA
MTEGNPSKLSELFQGSPLIDRLDEVIPGLVYVFDLVERRNVYTNRSLAELLGYSAAQIAGMGDQLLPTIIHPDDLARTAAHHSAMPELQHNRVVEIEFRVKTASGQWCWLHSWEAVLDRDASGTPLRLLGIAQDVTDRVQMEAELRHSRQLLSESEQRWRSIAENPFDFVVVIDRDFKFTFVNFVEPGLKVEDMIGKQSPLDFATGVDRVVMKTAFEYVMREGRSTSYEAYVEPLHKWYHSLVGPIKDGDVVTHLSVLTREITAEKSAQAQARQAEQQLRQMELKLAQAAKLEAVGQLAGGIAHDFNNLLTGIGGVVELLAMRLPEDDPNLKDVLELRHAVERGAGLTRQLLAFSRQQPIAPTVLNLNTLLEETSRMLRRLIGEDIELFLVPCTEDVHVRADRTQLEQVLLNLAVNARDAMAGGGGFTLELGRVHIDARDRHQHPDARPGDFVRLRATDTGTGMDDGTISRIFEPFFTTKPIGHGTGLGLSMVHGIVSKAGGFVQVSSRLGLGSTFDVWLPLAQAPKVAPESEPESRRGGRETVLLVEDEAMVLRFTTQLLERLGYEVVPAARAEEALEKIEAGGGFDLLLTDILLPGIDGHELYRRAAAKRGAFPVVFMSGYTDNLLAEKGLQEAGAAFLQKPFSHDELAAKVRAALDAHAARALCSG